MFKILHRKLTIVNALVLISFLFIFSYTIVSITSVSQSNKAKQELQMAANVIMKFTYDMNSFQLYGGSPDVMGSNSIPLYYIVWDNNRDFTPVTNLKTLDNDMLVNLENQRDIVFESKNQRYVNIRVAANSYRLYNVYYELPSGKGGVVQVFQSKNQDDSDLNDLFFVFMRIGLAGIIMLIIISSYLAKRSLEPVKQAYERQKEFIADASHELRTPLTVMKTNLELLSMKSQETIAENEKWFNNLMSETDTMSNLVQNLLTLAQVDNNQVKINMEEINFSNLTRSVCDKMELIMLEKNITFNSTIGDEIYIKGDKNRLEQLLVILIDNAIKYTAVEGKINVNLMSTPEKAVLSVLDSGMGISQEDIKKIFERFYRVDKVRSREQGGTGLGLSIAQWVVKIHKGNIKVNSEIGKGSEFIVEFPKHKNQTTNPQ